MVVYHEAGGGAFPSDKSFGMTLRDYFAASALPLAIQINKETNDANIGAGEWVWNAEDHAHVARVAYEVANAMLKERESNE
jgi:hypothetical protein